MKATKRIINTSDSNTISDRERHAKRSKAKGVSIGGKTLPKMRNAFHAMAVKGLTNRAPKPKPKPEPLRLKIKVQEKLTRHHNLEVSI